MGVLDTYLGQLPVELRAALLTEVGELDTQSLIGGVSGIFTLVGRQVLTAQAQSMTFSGLDGDADVLYLIIASGDQSVAGSRVRLLPNGLLTDQNCHGRAFGSGSLVTNDTYLPLLRGPTLAFYTSFAVLRARTGLPRTFLCLVGGHDSGTQGEVSILGGAWKDTTTKITSLVVDAPTPPPNGLEVGTDVSLFKLRLAV